MSSHQSSLAVARYNSNDDHLDDSDTCDDDDNGFNVILKSNINGELLSHIRGKYEERLRKVSLANLSKIYTDIVSDEVLEEMKFDAISMKYVPAHIAEMLEKYLSSEREHLLTKMLSQIGILQYDISKKQSVISNISSKNIYFEEQHNIDKRQLGVLENENTNLKEAIISLKDSNEFLKNNDVKLNIIAETHKNEVKILKSVIDQLAQEKKDLVVGIEERDIKINNINNNLIALNSKVAVNGEIGKANEKKENEYFNELKAVLQSTKAQRDDYVALANETSSKLQIITSEYDKIKAQLELKIDMEKKNSNKISKILKDFEVALINEQNSKSQMANNLNEKFKLYKHSMSIELTQEKKHNEILMTEILNLKSYNETKKNEKNVLIDENIIMKSEFQQCKSRLLALEKSLEEKNKIEIDLTQNVKQLSSQIQIEIQKITSTEKVRIDEKYAANEITRKMSADFFDKQNKYESEIANLNLKLVEENKKAKTLLETENLLNSYKYRLKEASDYLNITSSMISSMKEEFILKQQEDKKHYESIITEKDAIITNLQTNTESLENVIITEKVAQAKEIEMKNEEIRQLMNNVANTSEKLYKIQHSEALQISNKLETVLAEARGSSIKELHDEVQGLRKDEYVLRQLNGELTTKLHDTEIDRNNQIVSYKNSLEKEKLLESMNIKLEEVLKNERETSIKEIDLLSKMITDKDKVITEVRDEINSVVIEHSNYKKDMEVLLQTEIRKGVVLKNRISLLEKIMRAMAKEVKLYKTALLNDTLDVKQILYLSHQVFSEEYGKIIQAIIKKSTALYDKLVKIDERHLQDALVKLKNDHIVELTNTEDLFKVKIVELTDDYEEKVTNLHEKLSSMQEALRIISEPK